MNFDKIPSRQKLRSSTTKAKCVAWTTTFPVTDGEYVIPKPVMEKFPAMAMGIMQAADVGLDPEQFWWEVTSVYNPETGAQEFSHVIAFELDDLTKTISDVGKSLKDSAMKSYDKFLKGR